MVTTHIFIIWTAQDLSDSLAMFAKFFFEINPSAFAQAHTEWFSGMALWLKIVVFPSSLTNAP